jgi:ParB family chromosome partitioning protein
MKRGLGKGLASLLAEDLPTVNLTEGGYKSELSIDLLEPGNYQPRRNFDASSLQELADSIRENGVIQPIVVHEIDDSRYGIIAGERRWRAAKMAGLSFVPVIVNQLSGEKILEVSLIENIQREDLNAIEESEGYLRLVEDFNYTQDKIARMVGKSRSHIANMLRLNSLPQSIKDEIAKGALTMGHARSLIGHQMAEEIAAVVLEKSLNVRQTENLVKNWYKVNNRLKITANPSEEMIQMDSSDLKILVEALSEKFGMKIEIENNSMGEGRVTFYFGSLEQLDSILTKLT